MLDTELKPKRSIGDVMKKAVLPVVGILAGAALGVIYAALIVCEAVRAILHARQGRRRQSLRAALSCVLLLFFPFVFSCFLMADYRSSKADSGAWLADLHEGLDGDDIEDRMQRFAEDLEAGQVGVFEAEGFGYLKDAIDVKIFVNLGIKPWLYWQHHDVVTDEIGLDDLLPISDILAAEQTLHLIHEDVQQRDEMFRMVTCYFEQDGQLLRVVPMSPGFFRNVLDDERYVTLADTCSRARTMLQDGDVEAKGDREGR